MRVLFIPVLPEYRMLLLTVALIQLVLVSQVSILGRQKLSWRSAIVGPSGQVKGARPI